MIFLSWDLQTHQQGDRICFLQRELTGWKKLYPFVMPWSPPESLSHPATRFTVFEPGFCTGQAYPI